MFQYLFLLFVIIPVVEVWLLVTVGQQTGALLLVVLILGTAFIGARFLRQQGLSTLARAQSQIAAGQLPAAELVEGVLLIVAGAFLLTPGFVTDAVGFVLLWSRARRWVATAGVHFLTQRGHFAVYSSHQATSGTSGFEGKGESEMGNTFEGDYFREPQSEPEKDWRANRGIEHKGGGDGDNEDSTRRES